MKPFIAAILAMFALDTEEVRAQSYQVSGQVKDSLDQALEFATVRLLKEKDSTLVSGSLSDENGNFEISNVNPGNYLLTASMLGYNSPYVPISIVNEHISQNIVLQEAASQLEETVVTYKVPLVEKFAGKTVLNVENSLTGQGLSALEVLKQAPGVVVSEGNITLQGKNQVLVMIDDRPTYLNADQVAAMLQNMPASQISKIEVISNPSAKYDAAGNGGVINIKLKKKKKAGFNMSIDATYAQGMRPGTIDGMNFNFKKNKWNFFGDYRFNLGTDKSRTWVNLDYETPIDSTAFLRQFARGWENYFSHPFKIGADYSVSDKTTVGVLMNGNFGNNPSDFTNETRELDAQQQWLKLNTTQHSNKVKYGNAAGNIFVKHVFDSTGQELTVNADYARYFNKPKDEYATTFLNNLYQAYQDPSYINTRQQSIYNIYSGKVDYTKPFRKIHSIETGAKFVFIDTDNFMKLFNKVEDVFTIDTSLSNYFDYKENIDALYVSYNLQKEKWSLNAGLRMEHTRNKGITSDVMGNDSSFVRKYTDFFPSVSMTYKPLEKHQFTLGYNRRIDRPTFNDLNPFVFFLDPYVYHIGNPYLNPQYTHNISASYGFDKYFTISASYSHTNNLISELINAVEGTKKTYHTSANIGLVKVWNANISLPFNITKWWFTNTYAEINLREQIDEFNENANNRNTYAVVQSTHQFTLPKKFSLETSFFMQSKTYIGNILLKPLFNWSFAIQKSFFENKFSIKANVTDILYTMKVRADIPTSGLTSNYFERRNDSRALYLTFTYNFDWNNTGAYRNRNTGLDDVRNRAGN